jgi:beta-glucanase (GH16 family)
MVHLEKYIFRLLSVMPFLLLLAADVFAQSKFSKLVWADEFDYTGLPDSTRWSFNIGGQGWGNNELQYYTEKDTRNAMVANGVLKIIARKEKMENREYTSARLSTKNKAEFKYGRIEARAKVPASVGSWPAIWMLGNDKGKTGWPACGEIDIMEHKGSELNKIFGTLHYPGHSGGNANGKTIMIDKATEDFHVYAVEWDEKEISIYVNGIRYHTVSNDQSIPFNHNFFILLNVAIGGNFGGKVDPLFTVDSMEVDYVRVYQ